MAQPRRRNRRLPGGTSMTALSVDRLTDALVGAYAARHGMSYSGAFCEMATAMAFSDEAMQADIDSLMDDPTIAAIVAQRIGEADDASVISAGKQALENYRKRA